MATERDLAAWCQKRVHGLLALARGVTDPDLKHELLRMAADWQRRADEAEAEQAAEQQRSRRRRREAG
jgi:hypothetical protein